MALNKPANQSSTIASLSANRAVDGNLATALSAGSCSLTQATPGLASWWSVNLGQIYQVMVVNIVTDNQQRRLCRLVYLDYSNNLTDYVYFIKAIYCFLKLINIEMLSI